MGIVEIGDKFLDVLSVVGSLGIVGLGLYYINYISYMSSENIYLWGFNFFLGVMVIENALRGFKKDLCVLFPKNRKTYKHHK